MKNIGQIMKEYRKKKKMTQPELAAKLQEAGINITYKGISCWEQGTTEPGAAAFLQVCRILEVPDVMEEFFGYNPADPLSVLNDVGKQKVYSYIDMLAHPVSYLKENNVISYEEAREKHLRKLRLYDARVSAGHGEFMDSDQYTLIDVKEDEAADADFAVTINGDSMEPAYADHGIALVHQQDTLENGEIGIFYLNGDAYIKKFQDDRNGLYLVSLNKKYAPIPVNPDQDTFHIYGKVLN